MTSGSKRVDNPTDFAEEYVQRIEHEGHQALRRALLERYRVNVGLVAENTELKRKLRQPDVREVRLRFTDPGTLADLDGA